MARLPPELMLRIVDFVAPSQPDAAIIQPYDITTQTLRALALTCRSTSAYATRLIHQQCMFHIETSEKAKKLADTLRRHTSGRNITNLFLAPFEPDDRESYQDSSPLDDPATAVAVRDILIALAPTLRRLVIDMPLRSLYPDEDRSSVRPILRSGFEALVNIEDFVSIRDELYLDTVFRGSTPPPPPEPVVWSACWPKLRRLSLYNVYLEHDFWSYLANLKHIEMVILPRCDVPDQGGLDIKRHWINATRSSEATDHTMRPLTFVSIDVGSSQLSFDVRRDGWIRIDSQEKIEVLRADVPFNDRVAHTAITPREGLLRYTPSRAAVLTVSPFLNKKFFERNTGLTKKICLEQAAQILGCPVSSVLPTALQGASSFTVAKSDAQSGDSSIVQFRDLSSQLNETTQVLARRTYGYVVPNCSAVTCELSDKVHVYVMTLAGGLAFSAAQRDIYQDENAERLMVTIVNFASFVASSLSTTRQNTDGSALTGAYQQLAAWEAIPTQFQPKLAELRGRLPVILGREFPQVLNHPDLVEMNIQVDESSGAITGVIDWAGADYGASGVALASLELFLGVCTGEGVWIWHPHENRLRALFYKTLCTELNHYVQARNLIADDVEAARSFGLFVMYGYGAVAEPDGQDDRGPALAASCLAAGLGEGTAAQLFLQQHWGSGRCGHS